MTRMNVPDYFVPVRVNSGDSMSNKSLPRKLGLPLICSVFFITLVSNSNAASDNVCQSYAQSAAEQHHENIRLGCGFEGARWTDNKSAAFIYCKAVPEDLSQSETDQRKILHPNI